MKIYYQGIGDRSVGINAAEGYLEISSIYGQDEKEERAEFKKALAEFLSEWEDDKIWCYFEDECPDCGQYLEKDKRFNQDKVRYLRCQNPKCISNI